MTDDIRKIAEICKQQNGGKEDWRQEIVQRSQLTHKNGFLKCEDDKEGHEVHVCQLYHGASMASRLAYLKLLHSISWQYDIIHFLTYQMLL